MNYELLSLSEAVDAFNWFVAVGLFLLYGIVEWLNSSLPLLITRHQSSRSANTTLALYFIWGIEIIAFVNNYLYIIPIALGAWVGVYLLVEREKKVRPLKRSSTS